MKNIFNRYRNADLAILLIRIGLATIFVVHGISKFSNIDATISFFASFGLGIFSVYLVSIIELLAGIAMLIGIWTEIAGIAITIIMIVAIFTVKLKIGFLGGYELDIALLLPALAISFMGPGKYVLLPNKNSQT